MLKKTMTRLTIIIISLTFAVIGLSFNIQTSKQKVQGYVFDKKVNEPIPCCKVFFKGTTITTLTDLNGHFFFDSIPSGKNTLCIWLAGYDSLCTTNYLNTKKYYMTPRIELKGGPILEPQTPMKKGK
jgi:hypothetical protein